MMLSEAAKIIGADCSGPDLEWDAISLNSRQIQGAPLFIAIVGEHFDGHDFVEDAEKKGAVAAIVSRPITTSLPCLVVTDTRTALAELACHHRNQMSVVMMGVTGSCGKTTTKTLLAHILSQHGKTLSSERSFNNDIGVPLTLLQLESSHQYAVCEMGANHPGEIAMLTHWVKPDVAAITNAAAAHLEGFGDVHGVACAKGEIFQELAKGGIAVINVDDDYADFWKNQVGEHRVVTFGRQHPADVSAQSVVMNQYAQPCFQLILPKGQVTIQLQLIGEHNVMNALTAAAMAYAKDIPIAAIKVGLEGATTPGKRRLFEAKGYAGATVIDDTYNANPLSAAAAMSILAQRGGDSILVLGDMLELGDQADDLHRQLGEKAEQLGIQHLYCYGQHSRYAAEAFGKNAYFFEDRAALLAALRAYLHEEATVLIKGSNAMGMDKIAEALINPGFPPARE